MSPSLEIPVDSAASLTGAPLAAAPRTATPHTVAVDTVAADTVPAREKVFGVTLEMPERPTVERAVKNDGLSWILGGMFILFFTIGLRFRNNQKYVTSLLRNLVEVRVRQNVFDETVRETSFLILLNLLWSCSAGIILCRLIAHTVGDNPIWSFGIPALTTSPSLCMAICMGVMIVYTCFMALCYLMVGSVFSDLVKAKMWLKGFAASQGLLSILYFPLAMLLLFYPEWADILFWTALCTFLLAKIIFIWKGFRIFFTQFSSWVLFLYYLCSLEIVPLILTYWVACFLCGLLK